MKIEGDFIDLIFNIIENIPLFLTYVIPGYLFLELFNWISSKGETAKIDHLIFTSVTASFLLKVLFDFVTNSIINESSRLYPLLLILSGVMAGILGGYVVTGNKFNNRLASLHLGKTTNKNIWIDVLRPSCLIRVFMPDDTSYYGVFKYVEENNREPIVVLSNYQYLDKDGKILIDRFRQEEDIIMLNTSQFTKIEITYYKE